MFTVGEAPLAGIMDFPEEARAAGAPPHWLGYVSTPDADATVEQAKGLGGQVLMEPMSIPEVGRMAVLRDPQGAVFAVFTSASDALGREGPAGVGEFSWHSWPPRITRPVSTSTLPCSDGKRPPPWRWAIKGPTRCAGAENTSSGACTTCTRRFQPLHTGCFTSWFRISTRRSTR